MAMQKSTNASEDQSDDNGEEEVQEDEAALVSVAVAMYTAMSTDDRFTSLVAQSDMRDLAVPIRTFLATFFDGDEWPRVAVGRAVSGKELDALFDLLAELVASPVPLGEDVLVRALALLAGPRENDPRAVAFRKHVEEQVIRDVDGDGDHARRGASADTDDEVEGQVVGSVQRPGHAGAMNKLGSHNSHKAEVTNGSTGLSADNELLLEASELDNSYDTAADEDRKGEEDADSLADSGTTAGQQRLMTEMVSLGLREVSLTDVQIKAVEGTWELFLQGNTSNQAAGESLISAVLESVPSIASRFVTPRAVLGQRFAQAIDGLVRSLRHAQSLQILVEELGFSHLQRELTPETAVGFRNAVCDLLSLELSEQFTTDALDGWTELLDYVGTAIQYVKGAYSERIETILESWRSVMPGDGNESSSSSQNHNHQNHSAADRQSQSDQHGVVSAQEQRREELGKVQSPDVAAGGGRKGKASQEGDVVSIQVQQHKRKGQHQQSQHKSTSKQQQQKQQKAPSTFVEMFRFNAAVMGYSGRRWMAEVLRCFDSIVRNIANARRVQEECDLLSLRIARITKSHVKLSEYKSVMLASLRSLLPKEWSTDHETAWTWLWDIVARMLHHTLGKPRRWEAALQHALQRLDEGQKFEMRKDVYALFFQYAPAGQDHFKQSNTFLHYIAERVIDITVDIFRVPLKMVDDLSAIGLRHVGYGVPTYLFNPFVTACLESVRNALIASASPRKSKEEAEKHTDESEAVEALRWSLALVAKVVVRTIEEGSTAVMKAINMNSPLELRKAASQAPRGERATWMLCIQAGAQSISPLAWAISTARIDAAAAMLEDLLTIRADRDRYYFGAEDLFARHPDLIKMLCDEATALLPGLLDRLVWRSHMTEGGKRRVHYFVKYLLVNSADGSPAEVFRWLVHLQDPSLACHPIVSMLSDILWRRVAFLPFLMSKLFLVFTLVIFVYAQAVDIQPDISARDRWKRDVVFAGRVFIYSCSMTYLLWATLMRVRENWKEVMAARSSVAERGLLLLLSHVREWQEAMHLLLLLTLALMLCFEPILYCWGASTDSGMRFRDDCAATDSEFISTPYLVFSCGAMILYFLLTLDLCLLSNRIAAYVLVAKHVMTEFLLFVGGVALLALAFASALSTFRGHGGQVEESAVEDFQQISRGYSHFIRTLMHMVKESMYDELAISPVVMSAVLIFILLAGIFLWNLLVAQITCAYSELFKDMLGSARLGRMRIVSEFIPQLGRKRWQKFLASLALEKPLEFNTGDIGLSGGVQVFEAANLHPATTNTIERYGGNTEPSLPWPSSLEDFTNERIRHMEKVEKLLQKVLQKVLRRTKGSRKDGNSSSTLSKFSSLMSGTESMTASSSERD